jgi:pimeloyl-ACP methyl ester carboxylesterase
MTNQIGSSEQYLEVENHLRISYSDFPSNAGSDNQSKVFILSPSMGDVKEEYRYLIPLLQQAFPSSRIISMDLRGMGKSDSGFKIYTPEATGRDIIALIKNLDLDHVVLMGCSMSAASIVYAAGESSISSKIKSLVFLSPFAWDHDMPFGIPTLLNILLNSFTGPGFWSSYYKSLHTLQPHPVDLDGYIKKLSQNLKEPGRIVALRGHVFGAKSVCAERFPLLAQSRLPVMAIYGSKDPDFPGTGAIDKEISELRNRLPHVSADDVLVIEGAGHYPHVEKPETVVSAISRFLENIN